MATRGVMIRAGPSSARAALLARALGGRIARQEREEMPSDLHVEIVEDILHLMRFADEKVTLSIRDWIGTAILRRLMLTLPPGKLTKGYLKELPGPFFKKLVANAPGALIAAAFATREMIRAGNITGVMRGHLDWVKEPKGPAVKAELERLNLVTIKEISPRPMGDAGIYKAVKAANYKAGETAALKLSRSDKAGCVTIEELRQELMVHGGKLLRVAEDGKVTPDLYRVANALRPMKTKTRSAKLPERVKEGTLERVGHQSPEPTAEADRRRGQLKETLAEEIKKDQAALDAVLDWQDGSESIDTVAARHGLGADAIRACWDRLKYRMRLA